MKTKQPEIAAIAHAAYRSRRGVWEDVQWADLALDQREAWRAATRAVLSEARGRARWHPWQAAAFAAAAYSWAALCMALGWHDAATVSVLVAPAVMGALAILKPLWVHWRAYRASDF